MERLKGIELFVDSLRALARTDARALRGVRVVLLGADSPMPNYSLSRFGNGAGAARELQRAGLQVEHVSGLDSAGAQQYLRARAASSLVVTPSLVDNFPYAAIECARIPGLNVIGSRVGGLPEILGPDQIFEPRVDALAAELRARLAQGPLAAGRLVRYDAEAANRRWLEFHARIARAGGVAASGANAQHTHQAPRLLVRINCREGADELPRLLSSLARQTCPAFDVVLDGCEPAELERMSAWRASVRAAERERWTRSAAGGDGAASADSTYACLLEASEVAAPELVECLLNAARVSGDDSFGAYSAAMRDERGACTPGDPAEPIERYSRPLGEDPLSGLMDDVSIGETLCVRQTALDAVGGLHAARDRIVLRAKLALAGYRSDIIPAVLIYRRANPAPTPADTAFHRYQALASLSAQRLSGAGLKPLAAAIGSLYRTDTPQAKA